MPRNWLPFPSERGAKGLGLLTQACRWSESYRKLGRATEANSNQRLFGACDDPRRLNDTYIKMNDASFKRYMHKGGWCIDGCMKIMQERRGGREGYWRRKKSMYSQQSAFLWFH